jgi:hypothetical protein
MSIKNRIRSLIKGDFFIVAITISATFAMILGFRNETVGITYFFLCLAIIHVGEKFIIVNAEPVKP